jgi:N-acetylglucosamine-6-phosphate deacetylase
VYENDRTDFVPDSLHILNGAIPAEFTHVRPATADPEPAGFRRASIALAGDRIEGTAAPGWYAGRRRLDASGCLVLPGFVDVHVHGAAGHDTMDLTMDAGVDGLRPMAQFYARHGVTSFLATTMTASAEATLAAVRGVAAAMGKTNGGARPLGIHLEGPFLSPRFPGAQRADHIRPPDLAEFRRLVEAGPVRMITLAPEQPGAPELIAEARRRGIVVVMGHTAATYEQAEEGVNLGVSQATHTYNAMTGLHHRQPGTLGAVLSDDRVFAQLIADNIHVHPAAMKVLARCKGAQRTVLITDAMRAAGLAPGVYDLGGQRVTVRNGQCRLDDGTLAGSVLTMERALANFVQASGWSLAEAWAASSRTPAASIGLDGELGSIAPGYRADLVLFDNELEVVATLVGGKVVYLREPERFHLA